jgi:hypothetical protein
MLRGNIGHNNNAAYLWSNVDAPGGRDVYPPLVGKLLGGSPLQSVVFSAQNALSRMFPDPTNLAASASLAVNDADNLARTLRDSPKIDESSPLWKHIFARAEDNAQSGGLFATGSAQLANGLRNAKRLEAALASTASNDAQMMANQNPTLTSAVKRAIAFFGAGVTQAAMIVHSETAKSSAGPDLHFGPESSSSLVPLYTDLGTALAQIFDLLKSTMYTAPTGEQIPFIDVTTVVISTEFSRTQRSQSDSTSSVGMIGTDHNPLTNSVILAGKGVRGGLVVGESDLRDCDDMGKYTDVSDAHRSKDGSLTQSMGKPFDFANQRVRRVLLSTFDEHDYITMPSVTNTVFDIFGVPPENRFMPSAPTLDVLVAKKGA